MSFSFGPSPGGVKTHTTGITYIRKKHSSDDDSSSESSSDSDSDHHKKKKKKKKKVKSRSKERERKAKKKKKKKKKKKDKDKDKEKKKKKAKEEPVKLKSPVHTHPRKAAHASSGSAEFDVDFDDAFGDEPTVVRGAATTTAAAGDTANADFDPDFNEFDDAFEQPTPKAAAEFDAFAEDTNGKKKSTGGQSLEEQLAGMSFQSTIPVTSKRPSNTSTISQSDILDMYGSSNNGSNHYLAAIVGQQQPPPGPVGFVAPPMYAQPQPGARPPMLRAQTDTRLLGPQGGVQPYAQPMAPPQHVSPMQARPQFVRAATYTGPTMPLQQRPQPPYPVQRQGSFQGVLPNRGHTPAPRSNPRNGYVPPPQQQQQQQQQQLQHAHTSAQNPFDTNPFGPVSTTQASTPFDEPTPTAASQPTPFDEPTPVASSRAQNPFATPFDDDDDDWTQQ